VAFIAAIHAPTLHRPSAGKARFPEMVCSTVERRAAVPKSVLDAIKMGLWDYEPPEVEFSRFLASDAMPGTREKLQALAERVENGLPLWHAQDRNDIETPAPFSKPR
jgi:hypothetical protein